MMNEDDEIKNLIKAFEELGTDSFSSKDFHSTNPSKVIEPKELLKQLKDEAAKNSHKRWQTFLDFVTDCGINFIKASAFILPIIIVFSIWAVTKHTGYPDVANEIIVLSKKFFDMIIGFLVGNFLSGVFKKYKV